MVPEKTSRPLDALILGGGPAGCAAAKLLHAWGHRVRLITKRRRAPLGESIPPSARRIINVLDFATAFDAASMLEGRPTNRGNTVLWGSATPRLEGFGNAGCGWHVSTERLEAALHQAVVASGVSLQTVDSNAAELADLSSAHYVLDCTGHAGVLARSRHLRRYETSHRTIALVCLWRNLRGFRIPDPYHTVIESYDGGWAWSVPLTGDERFVAVMVDPQRSSLARETSSLAVYLREIKRTALLAAAIDDAELIQGPTGWDASMYDATAYVDDKVMLVGDAGSFIDPLSSAGVNKALASGWLAAVAVHTSLRYPERRNIALAFFDDRERQIYARFKMLTEQYLAQGATYHTHPFWQGRYDAGRADVVHAADGAELHEAYEQLRSRPVLSLQKHTDSLLIDRPEVRGNEIVLERRLARHDVPDGVRFYADVDLVALVEIAVRHSSVPAAFDAYNRRCPPVGLPNFLSALSAAIANKWLLWL